MSAYGLNMNASMIRDNDGKYTVGINLDDSNGMSINKEGEDSSLDNLLDKLLSNVLTDALKYRMELENDAEEELDEDDYVSVEEYEELVRENDALVDRIDELEAKLAKFYDTPKMDENPKITTSDTQWKNVTKKSNPNLEQAIADILKNIL